MRNPRTEHSLTEQPEPNAPTKSRKRANELNGSEWTRYSISVWRGLKRSLEERQLKHPAMFPAALIERLMLCYTKSDDKIILDPFSGSGSTLLAAKNLGRLGIGFELSDAYIALTEKRLGQGHLFHSDSGHAVHQKDARAMMDVLDPSSVDFCITSPPYWNILTRKRTADYKDVRNYGEDTADLGRISDYNQFIAELAKVWKQVFLALKPGKYFIVNVMDLRVGSQFIPFHMDTAQSVRDAGFNLDDIIIWDRSGDYNNLRALGFPSVFRINKVHEFLLIFQKPLE